MGLVELGPILVDCGLVDVQLRPVRAYGVRIPCGLVLAELLQLLEAGLLRAM